MHMSVACRRTVMRRGASARCPKQQGRFRVLSRKRPCYGTERRLQGCGGGLPVTMLWSFRRGLLEAHGEFHDVVVDFLLRAHFVRDAVAIVHDGRMVAAAEHLADIDE